MKKKNVKLNNLKFDFNIKDRVFNHTRTYKIRKISYLQQYSHKKGKKNTYYFIYYKIAAAR